MNSFTHARGAPLCLDFLSVTPDGERAHLQGQVRTRCVNIREVRRTSLQPGGSEEAWAAAVLVASPVPGASRDAEEQARGTVEEEVVAA